MLSKDGESHKGYMAELSDNLLCVFVCQENSNEQRIQQVLNIEDKVEYFQELEKLQQDF